jgi:hypothetical protein
MEDELAADMDQDVAIDDFTVNDVAATWQIMWQPHGRLCGSRAVDDVASDDVAIYWLNAKWAKID